MKVWKTAGHMTWIPASLLYRAATFGIVCGLFISSGLEGTGAFSYVVGTIGGLLALRTLFIHMVVSPDWIRVVNPIWSYRIKWEDIDDVWCEDCRLVWFGTGARRRRVILMRNGGGIPVVASQSIYWGTGFTEGDRTQRSFNRIQEAWGGSPGVESNDLEREA